MCISQVCFLQTEVVANDRGLMKVFPVSCVVFVNALLLDFLIWWITLIFQILNWPCFPGQINLTWLFIILFIYCWVC